MRDILHLCPFVIIVVFFLFLLLPSVSVNNCFPFDCSFPFPLLVCPFCKYPLPLLPVHTITVFLITVHYASVFLSPTLTLQSFLIAKVLLPLSHLACPSLHCQCEPKAALSPPRMPTFRAADSWSQARGPGAPNSTVTPWTWDALTGLQDAPPELVTTPPSALDVLGSTVTQQRVWMGSGVHGS